MSKAAAIQMASGPNVQANLDEAAKLINTAVKKCKYLGCSEIGVGTEFGNLYAREFYKACGFEEVGVIFEKILR